MIKLNAAGFSAPSVIQPLGPIGPDWDEVDAPEIALAKMGFPFRIFQNPKKCLLVISAVEVMNDEFPPKGPEYHLSVSRRTDRHPQPMRCTSAEANWVLAQFRLEGAEEDNHVPHGVVRNFWRPVAEPLVGLECVCKAEEPVIREEKGDFIWRPAPAK